MAKQGFAYPWRLADARTLRSTWRQLVKLYKEPDELDDPLCVSVCAAVQELATDRKLFGNTAAEVDVADSLLRFGNCVDSDGDCDDDDIPKF